MRLALTRHLEKETRTREIASVRPSVRPSVLALASIDPFPFVWEDSIKFALEMPGPS